MARLSVIKDPNEFSCGNVLQARRLVQSLRFIFRLFFLIDNFKANSYFTGKILNKETDILNNLYKCRKKGTSITEACLDATCEWRLKNEAFFNCTWVACNFGPFTLEEVGEMMGVTRERIRQIEAKALKKLQHKKRRDQLRDFASPNNEWDMI